MQNLFYCVCYIKYNLFPILADFEKETVIKAGTTIVLP